MNIGKSNLYDESLSFRYGLGSISVNSTEVEHNIAKLLTLLEVPMIQRIVFGFNLWIAISQNILKFFDDACDLFTVKL